MLRTLDLHERIDGYPYDGGAYLITEDGFLKKNSVREVAPPPADLRHQFTSYDGRYFEPCVRDVDHTGDVWFGTLDLDPDGNPYLYRAVVEAGRVEKVARVRYPFYAQEGQVPERPVKMSAGVIARQLSAFTPNRVSLGVATFRNSDREKAEALLMRLFGHPGYMCGFANWGLNWTMCFVPFDRPESADLVALRSLLGEPASREPKGRVGDYLILFTGQDYDCYRAPH